MAQNPDITKYFSEDSNSKSTQFFDKISTLNQSSAINEKKNDESMSRSTDGNDEPVVCKIFQSTNNKKMLESDPGSFFDMIGSVEHDLNSSFHQAEQNAGNSIVRDSTDVINSGKLQQESFLKPSRVTENERSRCAWIIPPAAREVLIELVTSLNGSYTPRRDVLTMPGVILEEDLKDTVYEAVHHYLGENEAAKRKVLTAAEVTEDDRGIRDLIQAGCYGAAVNLTKTLLTIYGQGAGRAGHPSKHTIHSIQLWFTRLALLVKIRSFSLAHVESEPFGDLDKPDMFFQFYPELYGGRTGTIVPFSLRLLIAQIPSYIGKHNLALARLHMVLGTVRKILSNLNKGLYEDGTAGDISREAKEEAIRLWTSRESRVLHVIVGCALAYKDYSLAIEVVELLIEREPDAEQQKCLQSALGRILLQLGDITSAERLFASARLGSGKFRIRDLLDTGLSHLAQYQYQEAYRAFEQASELDPKNITAINNKAVCLLYLGRLKEAVLLLEDVIQKNPKRALHESLLLNLCSLYELQRPYHLEAKLKLLMLVNQNKGDGFNIGCLKLQNKS